MRSGRDGDGRRKARRQCDGRVRLAEWPRGPYTKGYSTRPLAGPDSAYVETGLAPSCQRRHVPRWLILEWVEDPHIQLRKIPFISGCNNQTMHPGSSGNHGVLQQVKLLVIHDSAPFPKTLSIHREDLI